MLDREDAQLVNIYGFVVCWSVLFSNFAILSSRVSNFILPLEFILLPRLVNRHRGFFSMAILYGFGMAIANIMVYRYFPDPMMFIFD
ncbi:hypothetical protein BJP62_09545 [Jeongeupia sp. USM3]|nr:hypothetical protein BJP62_09545 [Jeongeupia sp. USM3]